MNSPNPLYQEFSKGGHFVILYPRYIVSQYIINEISEYLPTDTVFITADNTRKITDNNAVLLICESDISPQDIVNAVFGNNSVKKYNFYPKMTVNVVEHKIEKQHKRLQHSFTTTNDTIDATFFYPEIYNQQFITDSDIRNHLNSETDLMRYSEKIYNIIHSIREGGRHVICVENQNRCGVVLVSTILQQFNIKCSIMPCGLTDSDKVKFLLDYNISGNNALIISEHLNTTLYGITDVHFVNLLNINLYDNIISNLNNLTDSISDEWQVLNTVKFHYYPTVLQDKSEMILRTQDVVDYQNLTNMINKRRKIFSDLCRDSTTLIHWNLDE